MKKLFFIFFSLFLLMSIGLGHIAVAQEPPPAGATPVGEAIPAGPQSGEDLFNVLKVAVDWVFVIVITFAIIFIVLAGWQFITAGGDANAIAQARMKLLWGGIGIAVALVARGIPVVVNNLLFG